MSVTGAVQGSFFGEERDGSIECVYYEHPMETPRDHIIGSAQIAIRHKPILIRKVVDSTSPQFATAFYGAERLHNVTIRFVPTVHNTGSTPPIYFVRLSNASVASIKQIFFNAQSGVFMGWQLVEEINFYYHKIESGFNDVVQASSYWVNTP